MTFSRQLFCTTVFACASALLAQAQTSSTTTTRSFTTPPIGLASSETAQINLVNTASNSSNGTAASCAGTVSFLNAAGTAVGTATPFTIASGQIFSATLLFGRVGATGVRTEIRGVVTLTESSSSRTPCNLVSSLETYDTPSGVTHVYRSDQTGGDRGRF